MAIDKDLKRDVRVETGMRFVKAIPSPPEVKEAARLVLESKLKQKRLQLDAGAKESLITAICDDLLGFGPLEPLLRDNTITEIMVNGPDRIFIERSGRKTLSEIQFDDEGHLRTILEKMLGMANRRLDESSPYVDFSLEDGSRINAIISPLAVDGSTRIILGEIRGEEALDYLQAINSGHDGTLAVLHASTPADVVGRLETMAMYAGLELPSSDIRRQIASGLNLILQHEQ